jgi:hypothetical protein
VNKARTETHFRSEAFATPAAKQKARPRWSPEQNPPRKSDVAQNGSYGDFEVADDEPRAARIDPSADLPSVGSLRAPPGARPSETPATESAGDGIPSIDKPLKDLFNTDSTFERRGGNIPPAGHRVAEVPPSGVRTPAEAGTPTEKPRRGRYNDAMGVAETATDRPPSASIAADRPSTGQTPRARKAEPAPGVARIAIPLESNSGNRQPPDDADGTSTTSVPNHLPAAPRVATRTPTPTNTPRQALRYLQHRVVDGDSLTSLAEKYLGDRNRYPEIFHANRHILASPDILPIGTDLIIPRSATPAVAPSGGARGQYHSDGWLPRTEQPREQTLVPIPADAFPRRRG